ncbi:hypothetical protein BpHYR1_009556 [Brachionus plicatilis]|uniref:Uncharacterized protein n=1 Tax=Brachionus plicatilis TaxID=10195 RepID=A0A3M7RE47_BRAPC|nr:hypothetical protein BpHYR1_009556 [Brachionus plicatilis]
MQNVFDAENDAKYEPEPHRVISVIGKMVTDVKQISSLKDLNQSDHEDVTVRFLVDADVEQQPNEYFSIISSYSSTSRAFESGGRIEEATGEPMREKDDRAYL